jgi:hypothetical protein
MDKCGDRCLFNGYVIGKNCLICSVVIMSFTSAAAVHGYAV